MPAFLSDLPGQIARLQRRARAATMSIGIRIKLMPVTFALNHMVAPGRSYAELLALAGALGLARIEIRNDLAGVAIADGTPADAVAAQARAARIAILSINALQRFNDWNAERAAEAAALIAYAKASGAQALVLCPVNDLAFRPAEHDRLSGLRTAMKALKPLLDAAGIIGLVEPLGFAECSLRLKREAVDAIGDVAGNATFKLVHDTFHHHVAGETEIFAPETGLVHISGVADPAVPVSQMRDPHRVLVGPDDRVGNAGQIRALIAGGYAGPLSFEPFAPSVAALSDHGLAGITEALRRSIAFVEGELRSAAA